tara:strand:+ start:199 stop:402 length:204 start_codon:yes stop_codon:yes gene_type:complete
MFTLITTLIKAKNIYYIVSSSYIVIRNYKELMVVYDMASKTYSIIKYIIPSKEIKKDEDDELWTLIE